MINTIGIKKSTIFGSKTMKRRNDVRLGFRYQDEIYLRNHDDPQSNPKIQIFDNTEDEEPQTRLYYCALCRGELV